MALKLFELFGLIDVDNKKANEGIDSTESKASGLASKLGTVAKFAGGATLGVGAIGTAAFATANKIAGTTDRIDKLSQRLGLSREGFQKWEFVLSQNGVEIDSLQSGMKSLSQRIGDVIDGTGPGIEAFEKLGISQQFVIDNAENQELIFNEAIKALQGMEDGAEKAALAQELFSRSGQEMIPLLNQSAESTEELMMKAEELGLILSNEAVDAGVAFTDNLDQIKRSAGTLFGELTANLLPIFNKLFTYILDNLPQIKQFFADTFKTIMDVVTPAWELFKEKFLPIFVDIVDYWIANVFPVISDMVKMVQEKLQPVFEKLWTILIEDVLPIFQDIYKFVADVFSFVGPIILDTLEPALDLFVKIFDFMFEFLMPIFRNFVKFIREKLPIVGGVFKFVFEAIGDHINNIIKTISTLIDWVTKAIEAVKEFFRASENAEEQRARGQSQRGAPSSSISDNIDSATQRQSGRRGSSSGTTMNQTYIFNSPKPIDAAEAEKRVRKQNEILASGL